MIVGVVGTSTVHLSEGASVYGLGLIALLVFSRSVLDEPLVRARNRHDRALRTER